MSLSPITSHPRPAPARQSHSGGGQLRSFGRVSPAARRGQIMILTVFVMGVTLLAATTVGGLLTLYQIRAVGDIAASTRSIYAADAGVEWGLFRFFKPATSMVSPVFPNGAVVTITCYTSAGVAIGCRNAASRFIRSVGAFRQTNRALDLPLTEL